MQYARLQDTGALYILQRAFVENPGYYQVILFSSPTDLTTDDGRNTGAIVEVMGGGYSRKQFGGVGGWAADLYQAGIRDSGERMSSPGGVATVYVRPGSDTKFDFTGPLANNATIRGYAVLRPQPGDAIAAPGTSILGQVVWAEVFDTSQFFQPQRSGDYLTINEFILQLDLDGTYR